MSDFDVINVRDFGARGDTSADDTSAIQDALNHAGLVRAYQQIASIRGNVVSMPAGAYFISSQLVIPDSVILKGAGREATLIFTNSDFVRRAPDGARPSIMDTALVRIGNGRSIVMGSRVEDLMIDCRNTPNSIGIASSDCQEQSGLRNVAVINYTCFGAYFDGDSCIGGGVSNFEVSHSDFLPGIDAVDSTGIELKNASWKVNFQDISVVPMADQSIHPGYTPVRQMTGIRGHNAFLNAINVHIEGHHRGISFGAGATGTVTNLSGEQVDALIHIARREDGLPQGPVVVLGAKLSSGNNRDLGLDSFLARNDALGTTIPKATLGANDIMMLPFYSTATAGRATGTWNYLEGGTVIGAGGSPIAFHESAVFEAQDLTPPFPDHLRPNSMMDTDANMPLAAPGDTVVVTPSINPGNYLVWSAYIPAPGTVRIRLLNVAPIDSPSLSATDFTTNNPTQTSWRVDIWRHRD